MAKAQGKRSIKYWAKHPGYECLAGEPLEVTDEVIRIVNDEIYQIILSAIQKSDLLEGYSAGSQRVLAFEIYLALDDDEEEGHTP